jgi:hypothetical protein
MSIFSLVWGTSGKKESHRTLVDWLNNNPLEIGSLKEFRKGREDYYTWGDGVIVGSKDQVITKLCTKLGRIKKGKLFIQKAYDHSWQKSKLNSFCARIEASLPNGTLAGYYIGRIEQDKYAVFGYGFDYNEGWSEEPKTAEINKILNDTESGKPLDLDHFYWYGFNNIVLFFIYSR